MKKTWKRLCTGFLALATVVTALPTTPVHAESKQYWTESKERVGIVEKVMNDGSIGSTFNEGHLTVEGEDAYCIDINTDFKNGYKTRADAMIPIYEQIVEQVKALIRNGKLKENDNLPSVRSLAKELKISALTVKKAYDNLENEGFTVTIHGKGTYVTATNTELLLEEQKKELESDLERVIQKGRCYGISDEDIKKLFELILEG